MKSQTKIIVRYAETDQMGIAHHSNYAVWFEAGRTDFIKTFGISYTQMEKQGIMLPLVSLSCNFKIPANYEDELIIETSIKTVTPAKINFFYSVIRDGEVIANGETVHGFVSTETFKPISLKKKMPELFEKMKENEA